MLQRGHSGNGCDLASILCKYDFRKGDLFVLWWEWVRRVRNYLSRSHDFLVGSHECLLLFSPSCYGECFFDL